MPHSGETCSGYDWAELLGDRELADILDAIFCACASEIKTKGRRIRRDVFVAVEVRGQTLAAAARSLGLDIDVAREMQAKMRREIAVLRVVGVPRPKTAAPRGKPKANGCRCARA